MPTLTSVLSLISVLAEEWEMSPALWPLAALAVALVLLVVLGWVLLNLAPVVLAIVGAVLGIRWLIRNTRSPRPDQAVSILRQRYARGEITKEEFDAKLRDLGGSR
jgi:putative membrane protein